MAMRAELRGAIPLMYRLLTTVKSAELLRRSTFLSSDPIFGIDEEKNAGWPELGIEATMILLHSKKVPEYKGKLVLYGLDDLDLMLAA